MKKIIQLIAVVCCMCFVAEGFSQRSICYGFHKKNCVYEADENDEDTDYFYYNTQSKSGLFAQGTTSRMRCTIYRGMDYRITVCCETDLLGEQLVFKITDARTKEVIWDNSTAEGKKQFEFQSITTRQLIIEVTVPAGETKPEKGKAADAACVGVLIESKLTDRAGL